MSRLLVDAYYNDLARLKQVTGSITEGVVSDAFKDLLKGWSRQKNLVFASEYELISPQRTRIRPDGTILHALRVPLGYWEAKDETDDLDVEIEKKLRKGYPQDNILFEDSREAVLIQDRQPVMRCRMADGDELSRLLDLFFGYERAEIGEFRKAVDQFKRDLPAVLGALREMIDSAYAGNAPFRGAASEFLEHARSTINPTLAEADVREMLIQHVLTEDIFSQVFDDPDFHRNNNIARELYKLEELFVSGARKRGLMAALKPYYATIRSSAAGIGSHKEKQKFLKVIYENFYKVYDEKKADRLGVVYTPNEIVKFMIEGADWLCRTHFGKALIDEGVEILDPATGTGTFVCELLEHFRGQPDKLRRKCHDELHANEVAILPYYVANLNIEATYAEIMGEYAEFQNLCFVDTLDNVAGLGIKRGHQHDLFAGLSDENVERVKRQNRRKISVVIGNPPYNANQQNENDNNKNRAYPHIDDLIKRSYVAQSTAQKTKVYDMYARFFRWASDRLGDEGIIAFVTNRSFIDSRTFDGFRKVVEQEFAEIHIVDLGGDVRANPKLSGTKHNVFGIQTGVAISFFVKRRKKEPARIYYARRPEFDTAEEKLASLRTAVIELGAARRVAPDRSHNWIGLAENPWEDLLPLADKSTKSTKWASQERSIFKLFSSGVLSGRDEWLVTQSPAETLSRASFFVEEYDRWMAAGEPGGTVIKWSRNLKRRLAQRQRPGMISETIRQIQNRPYATMSFPFSRLLVDEIGWALDLFSGRENIAISFPFGPRLSFAAVASTAAPSYALFSLDPCQYVTRYRYAAAGQRIDNITTWAENKFRAEYGKAVTKDDIFAYVYAVLHDPVYREIYAINLKREFPRIPFYPDFRQWVEWGNRLLALHIGYEQIEPWPVDRRDVPDAKAREAGLPPKVLLRADKERGLVRVDSESELSGLPPEAWSYRLGNRSGVEWVLDQYREKTPKDPTIREKFNTYRFADYKEQVIDLIARVTRVSVETMAIAEAMKAAKR